MLKFKKDYWEEGVLDWEPQVDDGYGFTMFEISTSRLCERDPLLVDGVVYESLESSYLHRICDSPIPDGVFIPEKFPVRTAEADALAIQWLKDNPEEAWTIVDIEGYGIHPKVSVLGFKETFQDNGWAVAVKYPLAILYRDLDGELVVSTDIFEEV